jgi:hypothetical protein
MPQAVNDILNGNSEYDISDKDWSHNVSDHNGGSGSADNGTFEDLSFNRSRQEMNMTTEELEVADVQLQADADVLETVYEAAELPLESVESLNLAAEESVLDLLGDALGTAGEAIGTMVPPVLLAYKVGSRISDKPDVQLTAATFTGVLTTIGMLTPAAPFIAIGSVAWTTGAFFHKLANQ